MRSRDHQLTRDVLLDRTEQRREIQKNLNNGLLPPPVLEMARTLESFKARAILIGGLACNLYGSPRETHDADFFVAPNSTEQMRDTFKDMGLDTRGLTPGHLEKHNSMVRGSFVGVKMDFLNHIPGLEFESAFKQSFNVSHGEATIRVLDIDSLIASKEAKGRAHDLVDASYLTQKRKQIDEATSQG